MYCDARHEIPLDLAPVHDRIAEDPTDYDTASSDPVSPDIAERYREGQVLRLAMGLIEGASTASADRVANAERLREFGYRAGGASMLPTTEAGLVEQLGQLLRGGDRSLAQQLRLLPAFDASGHWRRAGCRDCAAWLDREFGVSRIVALERLRVARRLVELPVIEALFATAALSWSKVRELTRVADADSERELAAAAIELSASETVELCQRWRHREDDPEGSGTTAEEAAAVGAQRAFDNRSLTTRQLNAHTLRITLDLPVADAAAFLKSLECCEDALREDGERGDPDTKAKGGGQDGATTAGNDATDSPSADAAHTAQGDPAPPAQRSGPQFRADAALLMSAKALAHEGEAVAMADRYRVLLNMDARLLVENPDLSTRAPDELPSERPTLAGHGPVAIETARRIAASAGLTVIATLPNGEVVGVGASTRAWPAKMERAIRARDRHCQMPGCTATRWTQLHHVTMVSEGGETSIENGCLTCSSCHRRLHEGGLRLERVSADELELGDGGNALGLDVNQAARARAFVANVQRYRLVRADGTWVAGPKRRWQEAA